MRSPVISTYIELPAGQPLSADELRGFRMACTALIRWGRMIENESVSLGGQVGLMVPRNQMITHGGRMVRHCADALAVTIGRTGN